MGRTLTTSRFGEEFRDLVEIVDPHCSEFNPQLDLNDTSAQPVRVLSSYSENIDGRVDMSPPFNLPNPLAIYLSMTDNERTRPVRNDDPEDYPETRPRRRRETY